MGVAEHDVLAEDHVSAARTEEQWIKRFPQPETERSWARLRQRHDQLVLKERREARPADDKRDIFLAARSARVEDLILCFVDRRWLVHRWPASPATAERHVHVRIIRSG
jgi:hypothetical protein